MADAKNGAGGEETEILARLGDPVEAGALRELLEGEGIPVAMPGLTHRSLFGMMGAFVDIVVRVPRKDLARAKELLEGLRTASPPTEAEKPEERVRTDRLRRIAVFAALWLPFGAGHFYARRHRAAFVILAAQIVCVGLAIGLPAFWYAVPGIVLADMLGSVLAIGAVQRGKPVPTLAALAPVFALASIALVPAVRFAAPSLMAGSAMRRACERAAECEGGEAASTCIDRAAEDALEGRGWRDTEQACASCLDATGCRDTYRECGACRGLVELPLPTEDVTHGPPGTLPSDLQLVVPDLLGTHASDGMSEHDLDELLRSLEESPPPMPPSPPPMPSSR